MEQEHDIVQRYNAGQTLVEVHRATGVSEWRIRQVLKKSPLNTRGYYSKRKTLSTEEEVAVCALFRDSKMSRIEIAKQFGCSTSVVSRLVAQAKLQRFDPKEQRGEKNFAYKGGKVTTGGGYVNILADYKQYEEQVWIHPRASLDHGPAPR